MNKEEFLKKLAILYPHSFYDFSEKNGAKIRIPLREKMNAYKESLNGTPENFEKLYERMLHQHTGNYVPEINWLVQQMDEIQYIPKEIPRFDKSKVVPPPPEWHTELEKAREKMKQRKIARLLQQG